MEEDTEYTKLSVEDRCVHKLWKARLHGYEECKKTFQCIDDEKSPEWNKFLGLVKKFVIDSNAAAQEKGLEAVLAYVENAAVAGKTTNDVMSGIVTKCIAAPKAKTKELAVQVTLMYVEIEKHEAVQEELMKGTEAKNPKIVSTCINILTQALREFGPKVINVKPLMKKIPTLLEDRDKTVRDETKALVVEIYRWIGAPLKQQLNTLKPVQLAELETEFNNLNGEKASVKRYLRSQKPKEIRHADNESGDGESGDEVDNDDDNGNQPDIDPYELIDPVDILSKLPKDFYEKSESKKWQERKEALEALETLIKNPKLENGDYGDVVRVLKKIIGKDSNVVVVTLAGKCLTGLANGLKKRFSPYATACLPTILEKFKEKKQTVVVVLKECADAIFLSINIEQIMEDVLAALENKNPSVKAETAAFLSRCFARTPPPNLNKKLLKAYTGSLLKTLNESDPLVRDNSAEALGTAMKLVGEKAMAPFLIDLDNLKMSKIKECAEKAIIQVKMTAPKKSSDRPNTAPGKIQSPTRSSENDLKTKRPKSGAATKKPATKKTNTISSSSNLVGSKKAAPRAQTEKNLSNEEVDEMASETLPSEILSGLIDSNWKARLTAVEQLHEHLKQMDPSQVSSQLFVRIVGKKPGFKDTNFQVLKLRLELVKLLAENYPFSCTVTEYCLMDVTEKLGDVKNSAIAADTLTAIAEATSLELVANEVMSFAFNQKNPKVQQETLLWLSKALTEFGFSINTKALIENVKKAVAATNPGIRTAAITLIGTMYLYIGKGLLTFFENEKPALKQQIEQECEKFEGEVPPAPTRKLKSRRGQGDEDEETEVEDKVPMTQTDISDILPRVDISNQLTEPLLNELSDKNWKVRCEALQKIINILNESKLIKGSLGELPQGLALRLVDSNSKIAQTTLSLCETLATAMGPPIKQHIRTLFPGFLQCLGDSKAWIRTAAISCINTWGDQCGYKEFFDGEMIGTALKSGSPTLRNELWTWLAEKLPAIPTKQVSKEELLFCLPHLFSNVEDRNSDVRKSAQEAVLGFMIHLSYEAMLRNTEKLKPGSRTGVIAVLDKVRPNMPVKPLPSKKSAPSEDSGPKVVKSGGAVKAAKTGIKTKGASGGVKTTSSRKKDDDVDTSPLLAVNNMKHQRSIDEQKLKILKWNFTTPREEFVDLLKDLMSTANVNKTLMTNMFHADFRYHLKAIEMLTEDLPGNSKALVSNLDLILKWLTLRFFDTNPSVLLKGLDYLQTVFNFLIEDQYHMLENEAASFIPYLIIKIGDSKDAVRNGVKALFKQIASVYPVSKLFSYVMEGLKSKNSRQRAECLDQLGCLIESYGVTVCQPSPAAALKEVAKQIADRDNSVRNAALNCIVQAYYLEGERIYKLIGKISEKDQSLLDERIKRAAKNRPTKTVPNVKTRSSQVQAPTNDSNEMDENNYDDEVEDEPKMEEENDENIPYQYQQLQQQLQLQQQQQQSAQVKVSGPFGLDMDLLHKIEMSAPAKCRVPKLIDPNVDLNESVEFLNPTHQREVIPISPPKLLVPISENISPLNSSSSKEDSLDRAILGTASLDLSVAIQSMSHMESFLKSNQAYMVKSKEDKFINSINMQLKLLQTYPLHQGNAQVSKGFRTTFMITLTFYDSPVGLGKNVSLPHLKNLVDQMIGFLAENKLERLNDAEAYIRVINVIVLKIIDNSDHTTIICVLIKLLQERAGSNGPAKCEDLIMKCLWKIVKTIPNWAGDLDYDAILLEMHNFFRDYPTSWWKKQQKPDTPMRTIKTVLHAMTKVKGSTILSHLTLINNTDESELHPYLMRLITSVKTDDINIAKKSNSQIQNQKRSPDNRSGVSKQVQQQLSEIFKKIGSKHQAQEGLVQLYDFKHQHPEANLQPFLEKSHQYFQEFIEQGLKDIDKTRKNQNLLSGQANNNQHNTDEFKLGNSRDDEMNRISPMHRLERLRALEAQCMTSHSNQA